MKNFISYKVSAQMALATFNVAYTTKIEGEGEEQTKTPGATLSFCYGMFNSQSDIVKQMEEKPQIEPDQPQHATIFHPATSELSHEEFIQEYLNNLATSGSKSDLFPG